MDETGNWDPLLPPDLFSASARQHGAWILYALGCFVATSAATFITHTFMVKGVMVGLEKIESKRIKSSLQPHVISAVKSWPKILIAFYGQFVLYSWMGEFSVVGSIGCNLHIGVALSLLLMADSETRRSRSKIYVNLIILLITFGFVLLIRSSLFKLDTLIVIFMMFMGLWMLYFLLPLAYNIKYEEVVDLEEVDEENAHTCIPKVPASILNHGTGFQLFIDWILYANSITVSFIPNMTLFWCNPSNKSRAWLWPLSVLLGGAWVAVLMYLSCWWATVFGNSLRVPPEVTGLVFVGPLLSATDLVNLASKDRPYLWQGVTDGILSDCFLCLALPYFLSYLILGSPTIVFYDLQSGLLCLVLLAINLVLSHLVTLITRFKVVRIIYSVLLMAAYPLIFLAGSTAAIYHYI